MSHQGPPVRLYVRRLATASWFPVALFAAPAAPPSREALKEAGWKVRAEAVYEWTACEPVQRRPLAAQDAAQLALPARYWCCRHPGSRRGQWRPQCPCRCHGSA